MVAMYPGEFREWTTKFDYTTIVFADHFNTAQEELNALLNTVGLTPQIARNDPGSTPFTLLPVVDWIANAPEEDIDHVIEVISNTRGKTHRDIMDELARWWPDWAS